MTLTDTGPLVALVDEDDDCHEVCMVALRELAPLMITPWPCFTEAMYLLDRANGYRAQEGLWAFITTGLLVIHASDASEQAFMRELMSRYRDTPMDLADAALVAAAEVLGAKSIFSIDSDFYVYRLTNGTALEVIPGPRRKTRN